MGSFQLYFEMIGAVAFAVSGAALGIRKGMDLFSVAMMGMTTAVGGGSFTFAPNITIQGNADYNVMMNAMTDAKEQFEQWFNEMMRKQQRTAYAR